MKISTLGRLCLTFVLAPTLVSAQNSDEWLTLGNDHAHTRYSPAAEITAENFEELDVAWQWDGASFGAVSGRSTPTMVDGILYTVAGNKRYVVAIDAKTGDTLWTYREPDTPPRRIFNARRLRERRWFCKD